MKIAVIAALPGELKPLVKGWTRVPTKVRGLAMWKRPGGPDEVFAVCGGMGAAAAGRAFAAAEAGGAVDLVLSVGWAGALTEETDLSPVMSEVIDARTGERFALTAGKLRVVTTATVADAAEKRRLAATYGAVMVDMEAAAVARLAQMRGIPMGCFKVVSDDVHAKLPDLNPYIDEAGQLRLGGFLAHVALRPWYWGALLQLGRRSARVSHDLARTIERFLLTKDLEQAGSVEL